MRVWRRMETISWRDMKTNEEVLQLVEKKKPHGCDLEKEEKLDWPNTQKWKPAKGGDRGSDDKKKTKGRKRLGMLNEFLKEASYAELKRKAENKKEWKTWKPRTCLTAEHQRRTTTTKSKWQVRSRIHDTQVTDDNKLNLTGVAFNCMAHENDDK